MGKRLAKGSGKARRRPERGGVSRASGGRGYRGLARGEAAANVLRTLPATDELENVPAFGDLRADEAQLAAFAEACGRVAERLGEACGVVFRHPQEKTLWLVGDTIWRDDIAADLLKLRPDVVVLNAGYAHVIGFGPIIMGKEDLLNVHFTLPEAKIMAIHLEAVNHCLVSREEMRQYALDNQIADVVSIPQDGETVVY